MKPNYNEICTLLEYYGKQLTGNLSYADRKIIIQRIREWADQLEAAWNNR